MNNVQKLYIEHNESAERYYVKLRSGIFCI